MQVGIIAANNIRFSPYIFFYTRILDEMNIKYELIFPNREEVVDKTTISTHIIKWKRMRNPLISYFLYTNEVKKIIKKRKYDYLIVLTTNIAVFLSFWLKHKYQKKYIIDIRDYTHEEIKVYYWLEKTAVSNSQLNIISSKGFQNFLPKGKYTVCHNTSTKDLLENKYCFDNSRKPIRIAYIGKGGYINECKKICELVKRDERFQMHIYGIKEIPDELAQYKNCRNILFNGVFDPQNKNSIIESIDILFNVYGNGCLLLDYALSNKLYDSFLFVKPILTSPRTYMSEMAGPLAYDIDFEKEKDLDNLYTWYNTINTKDVESYAHCKLREVIQENNNAICEIKKALRAMDNKQE